MAADMTWRPGTERPKLKPRETLEPDLAVQESDPVLILSDGEYDLGQWVIESDPGDPSYRAEYWANMDGIRVRVEWWAELPKKPKGGK